MGAQSGEWVFIKAINLRTLQHGVIRTALPLDQESGPWQGILKMNGHIELWVLMLPRGRSLVFIICSLSLSSEETTFWHKTPHAVAATHKTYILCLCIHIYCRNFRYTWPSPLTPSEMSTFDVHAFSFTTPYVFHYFMEPGHIHASGAYDKPILFQKSVSFVRWYDWCRQTKCDRNVSSGAVLYVRTLLLVAFFVGSQLSSSLWYIYHVRLQTVCWEISHFTHLFLSLA